jgi:hypothetical protein
MSPKKTMKWIFAAILIGLVSAGGLMVWASPPDATGEVGIAPAGPAGHGPGRGAAPVAVPAPVPRPPDQQIDIGAKLIGTAVLERGPSIAVLQLATGTRYVREGDEIVSGLRLVKVSRDRIKVERAGVHQEIRQGSNAEPQYQAHSGPMRGEPAQGDVDRLWETQGRTGRSLFYSHYRKPQNQ